ncbi:PPR37 phosphatase, partial [Ptilonorhynchus violaceus]|nr:PPR37 phosphatase [Ptilonorhynchus violaceus]
QTSCLQLLDARNTPLPEAAAPLVARALRISGSLAVLHLENTSLSGRPLMLLATALKMNVTLRELYLADNKLNGLQDSAQLGNLLKFNGYIQILDLRNNHILDSGLAYICEGLREQRQGLVTLVLWNNQLSHTGMAYLGMTLPHTQSLETLNLGHNPIGNEGVRNLKNGLIGNRSVLRLGLACTKLTCEGAVAVAEFIAESPRLLRLDLRENEIKTGGLMALSLALRVSRSLLRLDLDREPKKEAVKSFLETQKALLAEIQNGCKRNFILAKEKEEKEQQLRESSSMPDIAGAEPPDADPDPDPDPGGASEPAESEEAPSENGAAAPEGDSGSDTDEEPEEDSRPGKAREERRECRAAPGNPGNGERRECRAVPCPGNAGNGERRVSISSPGRGRKVFVVTRVENPPAIPEGAGAVPELAAVPGFPAPARSVGAVPERSCGSPSREAPLPNGLKTDFARALPDGGPEGDGKTGTCAARHELSCSKNEQELEELLLEASQDTAPEPL